MKLIRDFYGRPYAIHLWRFVFYYPMIFRDKFYWSLCHGGIIVDFKGKRCHARYWKYFLCIIPFSETRPPNPQDQRAGYQDTEK